MMMISNRDEALLYLKTFKITELDEVAKECGVNVHTLLAFRYQRHKDQRWSTIEAVLTHKQNRAKQEIA